MSSAVAPVAAPAPTPADAPAWWVWPLLILLSGSLLVVLLVLALYVAAMRAPDSKVTR